MDDPVHSLRRHAVAGLVAIGLFALALGGWASTTEIAGAVIAQGNIVPLAGSKSVQHPDGGVVTEILARDGDHVAAGQVLVRLDSTTVSANLAVIVSQLSAAFALEARLTAESTGASDIAVPEKLADWPDRATFDQLLAEQDKLRRSRADEQAGLNAQLAEQIRQLEEQIAGYAAQRTAIATQHKILADETSSNETLLRSGLVEVTRINTARRELAELDGDDGNLAAEIAGARTAIAGNRAKMAETEASFRASVLEDLRDVGLQIAELLQQKIASEDTLAKLTIRAPQAGVIHESTVRTVGGVVGAGETLMLVVPTDDGLALEARVSPLDVDKLFAGQAATIRLSGLDPRTTPQLDATVDTISPDLTKDTSTGSTYYEIRLTLPPEQLARLPGGQTLVPGMPAEAFMRTSDRTVLTYLLAPFGTQLSHIFRED
ncbi:MAG: HlyD family type I secretion periplasmic adaptor subunit [Rubrivivax sp.]